MSEELIPEYDKRSDVLYIVTENNRPAIGSEDKFGAVWRNASDNGELVGVTLIGFKEYWQQHKDYLVKEIAKRFNVTEGTATSVLEKGASDE